MFFLEPLSYFPGLIIRKVINKVKNREMRKFRVTTTPKIKQDIYYPDKNARFSMSLSIFLSSAIYVEECEEMNLCCLRSIFRLPEKKSNLFILPFSFRYYFRSLKKKSNFSSLRSRSILADIFSNLPSFYNKYCFLDSAIISFKDVSASSVNCLVDSTIWIYGFCDVDKYVSKLAQ